MTIADATARLARRALPRYRGALCHHIGCGAIATRDAYDRHYNLVRACPDPDHGKETGMTVPPVIVQPITTYQGQYGYVIYRGTGEAMCLVRQHPGPPIDLGATIGPHILAGVMLTVSVHQWNSLVINMPLWESLRADLR